MIFRKQKMRTWMHVLLLTISSITVVLAQDEDTGEDRVQSAKVALITRRLNLTTEQSSPFWAVYDEFDKERKENIRSLNKLKDRFQVASDEELKAGLKQMVEVRQKDVSIERDYLNKFTKVITSRQTADLYKVEFEFQKAIWDRVVKGYGKNGESLESERVAFLTNKMKLTAEQAKQFWPVYNEFEKEKEKAQQAASQVRNSISSGSSEEEIKSVLKQLIELRQKEVDSMRRQVDKFLKIVNSRQVAMFYKGEIDFRRKIIREWREQRRERIQDNMGGRRQQFQERREQRQERLNH
ncbi:Spy/CpxP family protein refolding chaperone [Xanthocytophaga agilis]|uniref:Spy/CpxP family protein refolding chaperone n=1 Tax=Xanthocytophaga agilis TaxID=3048010 RepID=A0AAE3UHR3_9BACT|nr:Spy/CpxP family protein refolding chaperone [Xanthocytophaga agilis]MDJ1502908.1 Spy/CpxP family protein refolding chaperone [Xanthocytophaga agilis]